MEIKKRKGISLIVLVVTIVVIIILAGAVILTLNQNNPVTAANKATFLNDLRSFQTELVLHHTKQYADTSGVYNPKKLQADETSVTYEDTVDTSKTMYDLIPSMQRSGRYAGQFEVVEGELVFKGSDPDRQNWSKESGTTVLIVGEPKVSIMNPNKSVISQGTDIIYTVKFSSNAPLSSVNLSGKVEVTDNSGVPLTTQPNITIGTVSGTSSDATRQIDITIKTNTLLDGAYKLKIKAGVVTNSNNISNTTDTLSLIGFDIDSNAPENPTMSASPTVWTNGNVMVAITYSGDSVTKEYSFDATNWNTYMSSIVVNTNNTTVYARGKDSAGNESGLATLTVANIDIDIPIVIFGTNGASNIQTSSTTVTVSDVGGSALNTGTLQYIWDTQNVAAPGSGWAAFTNGQTISKGLVTGTYYLWIKANDNAGNNVTTKSNAFDIDNAPPSNPSMAGNPTEWTNGNVIVTVTYSGDTTVKEYSLDGNTWSAYSSGITVTTNNTTVYARGKDATGNQSGQSSITITNIDRTAPSVVLGNPSSYNIKPGQTVTMPMLIIESESGIDETTISAANIIIEKIGINTADISVTGSGNNRTIIIDNIVGEGSFTVRVNGIKDITGNVLSTPVISRQVLVSVPTSIISNTSITANSNRVSYGSSSPQKMFDGNTTDDYEKYGCYFWQPTLPLHINFILDTPRKIYKIRYFTYFTGSYEPTDFSIQGSNDTTNGSDGTWNTIRTYTNYPTISGNVWGEVVVASPTTYKAYKMNIIKTDDLNNNQILYNEMELYEY